MKKSIIIVVIILIIITGVRVYMYTHATVPVSAVTPTDKTVVYACSLGRSITATFHLPQDATVSLVLSDGRSMAVPHAISASGARYANTDESFVFWNKGNTAFITEGVATSSLMTYTDCVERDTTVNATTTYKNDQFGFQIEYPSTLIATTTFETHYLLSKTWRVGAPAGSKGTGVLAIPVFRIDQGPVATGRTYPLYYDAEVRVSVSSTTSSVASCLKPDAGYMSQPQTDVMIGGVTFKKFSIEDGAMMQYMDAESYRAVHNGACYAIEQIRTGSHYRDETMSVGLSQVELDAYYNQVGDIVQTFQFTK